MKQILKQNIYMYGVQGSILTWVEKDVCILLIQVIQGG